MVKIFLHFLIYQEALPHILLCILSHLNFLIFDENFVLFFNSVTNGLLRKGPHILCRWGYYIERDPRFSAVVVLGSSPLPIQSARIGSSTGTIRKERPRDVRKGNIPAEVGERGCAPGNELALSLSHIKSASSLCSFAFQKSRYMHGIYKYYIMLVFQPLRRDVQPEQRPDSDRHACRGGGESLHSPDRYEYNY